MGSTGVSTFDLLGDIPPEQRILMRLFMRRIRMTMAEMSQAMTELPPEKSLTPQQLKDTLTMLVESGWIRRIEEQGQEIFTIQQMPKSS